MSSAVPTEIIRGEQFAKSFNEEAIRSFCSAKIDTKDIFPIVETDHVFEEGVVNTLDDL